MTDIISIATNQPIVKWGFACLVLCTFWVTVMYAVVRQRTEIGHCVLSLQLIHFEFVIEFVISCLKNIICVVVE